MGRFPNGASVGKLAEVTLPRRTLQRRLARLVDQKRLTRRGRGPVQTRQPVGYKRAFLDEYRPNESYYLSTALRKHLSEIGRPPDNNLPAGTHARKVLHRVLIDLSWNSSRLEVPQLIDECFQQILDTAEAITDPFEQAFFTRVHLLYLQPFEDVNKRVSRLVVNLPFIRLNLSPLSFIDVPTRAYVDGVLGVYEVNQTELLRDVFVWAYERSSARYSVVRQSLGEPDRFRIRYRTIIADTVKDTVCRQMDKKSVAVYVPYGYTVVPTSLNSLMVFPDY